MHVHVDSLTYQLVSLGNQTTNRRWMSPDQHRVNVGRQLRSDRVDSLKLLLSDAFSSPRELTCSGMSMFVVSGVWCLWTTCNLTIVCTTVSMNVEAVEGAIAQILLKQWPAWRLTRPVLRILMAQRAAVVRRFRIATVSFPGPSPCSGASQPPTSLRRPGNI